MKKPVALIIMDGFGYSKSENGNAVFTAETPNIDRISNEYPSTLMRASGLDVGLPDGQMGNSEVGHTNIGAGRIVYQDLTRVTKSIADGDFFENEVLCHAMENAKEHALHIMGLLSDGGVHSHIDHLKAILKMAEMKGVERVYVHAFTDGRDTDPRSAIGYAKETLEAMKETTGEFASVSGRYYAMDRDKRWERTELAYNAMVRGEGNKSECIIDAIEASYADDKNDEFIIPTVIMKDGKPVGTIKENDSVIFFNFRPDRARQITRAIAVEDFDGFKREFFNTYFVCLTEYDASIEKDVNVAYKPQSLVNTLGEYLAKNGKTQLRAAETEKYAHVTFFFNGGVEEPNENEDRLLIPSPKVATYDLQPEMSAFELLEKTEEKLAEDKYDFIAINFANPDMVGHTGSMEAAVKAVETVDKCVGELVDKIVSMGGSAIITADHGNAELMTDPETGKVVTAHSTNPVPFIVAGEEFKGLKLMDDGRLSDIAPTVLDMMHMEQPAEMTGHSLIIR
ncbi:2,3-bisphosphoglycerate-independent phosphoglycerate mutase [Peptacetobacter hominis]|uniref:2,3-bisphosphoglycerate-independent phosphoglycerate mutase n=1 Tax=Peptacetobacter hominis TaxID=2743610 RepID=A0A544QXY4_9FIRM|nr:2,3-bisphosphoglycerate-independent phosphoglycerate mutase [Peptacetobacter hominis]TQQ85524.1 2,3-bisphosphoglycerate-independent phosphoglycerate mutase [Peptacetobacter hominis]